MKKSIHKLFNTRAVTLLLLIALFSAILCGCGCNHEWSPATYNTPKTCTLCGKTEGKALNKNTQIVKDGYEQAIAEIKNGNNAYYLYDLILETLYFLDDILCDTSSELYQAVSGDDSFEGIVSFLNPNWENLSASRLNSRVQNSLNTLEPKSGDYFSTLINKLSKMDSVSGTISSTKVDIVVDDMDTFVNEFDLSSTAIGCLLAAVEQYNDTNPEIEPLLQFMENGFKIQWQSKDSSTILNLNS